MRALLEGGADVNVRGNDGDSPLHACAERGELECMVVLLAKGADRDVRSNDGSTPLHGAAVHGHVECLRTLIAVGADKEAKNAAGERPVDVAKDPQALDILRGPTLPRTQARRAYMDG